MPTDPLFERFQQKKSDQDRRQGKRKSGRPRSSRRTLKIGLIIAAVVIAIIIILRVLGFYLDWLWFGEVGFRTVFWRTFWGQLAVGAAGFGIFFLILWPNLELARRLAPEFKASEGEDVVELVRSRARKLALWGGLAIALLSAVVAGYVASGNWLTFVEAIYGKEFGVNDPIFNHDVGFYVFTVPAWHSVQSFVFATVLVTIVFTTVMHLALGGDFTVPAQQQRGASGRVPRPQIGFKLPPRAVSHISALLAVLFITIGVGQLFKAWDYLSQPSGVVFGVGYTDAVARIPAARILMGVAFVIAAILIYNVWKRLRWWPFVIVGWVVVFIIVQWVYPAIVQNLIVNPNQLQKEREYLGYTLDSTKRAYALNDIDQQRVQMGEGLTPEALEAAEVTVRNVRLWDPATLVTSYRQLQELRPYYSFVDADVDRYVVDDVLRQTMLSARELNIAGLPENAQTWVNQHITYTHGYGIALSAVNQVTDDGSPDFLVKDIPPQSAVESLEIDQPRIYYGEIGTDYTLVGTTEREFDYPGSDRDVFTKYSGEGGISVNSFFTKLALCWRFKTIKFFTTDVFTDQSKAILVNNIRERLAKAAPFLQQDKDPYMVVADGKLYWIIDCYTQTRRYPYSDPDGSLNYIRNSVKAVIDAYNGTVRLYVFDTEDPLIQTYEAAFPGILYPESEMPEGLREHVRYAEGFFNVQARIYATYHVDDVEVLYNRGDQWEIPENVSDSRGPMPAYYVILRLPEAENEEFTLMLPYVPNGRKNMLAWLGARSDGEEYGTAVTILFSQGELIYGPGQVEAAINQDPRVSEQLTLWDQQGSNAISGNLLIWPIFNTLLYVQPLYLEAEETQLPQVKQVIVFYRSPPGATAGPQGQFVAMRPTLGEALEEIFGTTAGAEEPTSGGTPTPSPTPSPGTTPSPTPTTGPTVAPTSSPGTLPSDVAALIEQANTQFEAAQAALQRGDFTEYGRQIELLQETLRQLEGLR